MSRFSVKALVARLAGALGYSIVKSERFERLVGAADRGNRLALIGEVPEAQLRAALDALEQSPSQLGQDLFVLGHLGWKTGGYFVEFGATNGRTLSNTWLLDRHFGWRGVLAEPGRLWRDDLIAQGRNAYLEFDCVWSESGQVLAFSETAYPEVSTLSAFKDRDGHDRSDAKSYEVRTISLLDLLAKVGAPAVIDYLSIDTEGSELAILQAFDFGKYRFRCITCEHNFTADREKIHALLSAHGYRRVHEDLSQFDDWYVSEG